MSGTGMSDAGKYVLRRFALLVGILVAIMVAITVTIFVVQGARGYLVSVCHPAQPAIAADAHGADTADAAFHAWLATQPGWTTPQKNWTATVHNDRGEYDFRTWRVTLSRQESGWFVTQVRCG